MATQFDEMDDPNKKGQPGAGGSVKTSGGSSAPAATDGGLGSGWTNLQTYLTANKDGSGGVPQDLINMNQAQLNQDIGKADTASNNWAAGQIQNGQKTGDYGSGGTSGLEQGYQNAVNHVKGIGNDFIDHSKDNSKQSNPEADHSQYYEQKVGLQNKYGYGKGFAALDHFLGSQNGRPEISAWQDSTIAGLKNDAGEYKGIASAKNQVFNAGLNSSPVNKDIFSGGAQNNANPFVTTPVDVKVPDNFGAGLQQDLFGGGAQGVPKPKPQPQTQTLTRGNRKAY